MRGTQPGQTITLWTLECGSSLSSFTFKIGAGRCAMGDNPLKAESSFERLWPASGSHAWRWHMHTVWTSFEVVPWWFHFPPAWIGKNQAISEMSPSLRRPGHHRSGQFLPKWPKTAEIEKLGPPSNVGRWRTGRFSHFLLERRWHSISVLPGYLMATETRDRSLSC